ncbi:Biotin carboxyl carrier protein of acetyl-CoA carboxylase 1 [Nymphaea thermarum]|nr:Biotin carboxyl carrier protein of acetyl-CoA carboxylase 1 [Nymphaea thermarum]
MASSSSIPAASAAPVAAKTSRVGAQCHLVRSNLSFRPSPRPNLAGSLQHRSTIMKSQLNEVPVGGSSHPSNTSADNSSVAKPQKEDIESEKQNVSTASVSDSSITEFMAEVANLVKLVDSRDIVELQLKQLDCELVIRKKEALPQPPSPAPMVMMQPTPQPMASTQPPPAPVAAPAPAPSAIPALPPPAAKSSRSSHPPLKCPMAGTFYRSPGPGEPPFVKVGDKVKKGQVLCIVEAMKLMNEIEVSGETYKLLPLSLFRAMFVGKLEVASQRYQTDSELTVDAFSKRVTSLKTELVTTLSLAVSPSSYAAPLRANTLVL